MKRLKIALFIDIYYPIVDGVVTVVNNYAKRMAEFADVTVFCPKPKGSYDDSIYNYNISRCFSFKIVGIDYTVGMPIFDRKFKKAFYQENFDIVHIHSPFFVSRFGVKYAKTRNIPLIATLHSQFKRDYMLATKSKFLTKRLLNFTIKPFNKCDECWAVNDVVKDIFTLDYGVTTPCIVQPNATDFKTVDYAESVEVLNEKYGIEPDEKLLLFSGRLVQIKNIFFIAEGLKKIKDKGVKFRMAFVGTGFEEEKLKKKIREYGMDEQVIFTGQICDRNLLALFYRRACLFLFPSLYDSSSLVQIEAASQKTPTLFIRGSATSATAKEDVSAIMCDNDVDDFANKIIYALENEDYLERISEGAYTHLYKTWDEAVISVYQRYLQLIENKKINK